MKIFRRRSIWQSLNTYLFIIFAPIFYTFSFSIVAISFTHFPSGGYNIYQQVALNILAYMVAILIAILPTLLFLSMRYIIVDEEYITFKHAITKCEKRFKFEDIRSYEMVHTKISTYLKLKLDDGKSKSIAVEMVSEPQLKKICRIIESKLGK